MDEEKKVETTEETTEQLNDIAGMVLDSIMNKTEVVPLSKYIEEALVSIRAADMEGRHDAEAECQVLEKVGQCAKTLEDAVAELSIPPTVDVLNSALRDIFDSVLQNKRTLAMLTAELVRCSVDDAKAVVLIDKLAELGAHLGTLYTEQATSAMASVYVDARAKLRETHTASVAAYEKDLAECGGDHRELKKKLILESLKNLKERLRASGQLQDNPGADEPGDNTGGEGSAEAPEGGADNA